MIRILICDDQEIILEGLQTILGVVPQFEVVATARDGAEAFEKAGIHQPDIVLMDLNMPSVNGVQATRMIRERYPNVKVLVLTTYDDDEWVFDAVRAGAAGYLLKDTPREQLIAAIRGTVEGTTHIDPHVAGKLLDQLSTPGSVPAVGTSLGADLTERELAILRLLADGLSNADIADRLHLSKGTVQNYVSDILAKLDVADRTQAAVLALRHGLVS